ncbi:Nitroreductase [Saitoella complicata NRRL Y-17804]|nr:Nitroreductase [Saitoella complicata NRRL Y-17804]ODQ50145.1 Nitroreductase [Saitoella complicata NRRL Y-17804]
MSNANAFLSAIESRRTYYQITPESTIPDSRIQEIVSHAVKHVPSSFNSQSSRVVVLLKDEHKKVWDFTKDVLKSIVPEDQFPATEQRINGFQNGYGTILFFEDQIPVQELQKNLPTYADRFPTWAQHTSGMLQLTIWTALEQEGLGASLQHYNPLIDEKIKGEWGIPELWSLVAQMPFGKPGGEPGPKEYQPVEERVKVFGN